MIVDNNNNNYRYYNILYATMWLLEFISSGPSLRQQKILCNMSYETRQKALNLSVLLVYINLSKFVKAITS